MFKIPVVIWIANAAARLAGTHGDVTQQAEVAGCSRQTVYDHAQKVQAAMAQNQRSCHRVPFGLDC
jgi:alkanesulfonate monooxygenase SsuD/methylene tetrahydromethanopterin reductase-like flavin-dependent oxidoreductase (luciferase family)